MTLLIMPSVVSMPPNMITAALEMTSAVVSAGAAAVPASLFSVLPSLPAPAVPPSPRAPAAAARSDAGSLADPITAVSRALSEPNASAPATVARSRRAWSSRASSPPGTGLCAPVRADTEPTIAAYQPSTVAGSASPRPRASATTATASGQAGPQVRGTVRPHGRHQAVCFGHHERGQPCVDLGAAKALGERSTVAAVR